MTILEILPIFVGEGVLQSKGLYACKYDGYPVHQLKYLFDCWNNPAFILKQINSNKRQLLSQPLNFETISQITEQLLDEINELESIFLPKNFDDLSSCLKNLDAVFQPLISNSETNKFKAKTEKKEIKHGLLRIYGLKMGPELFVVTGGGIKTTRTMGQSKALLLELDRLEQVNQLITKNNINTSHFKGQQFQLY